MSTTNYRCPKCDLPMNPTGVYVCKNCGARYCSFCASSMGCRCTSCNSHFGKLHKEK